MKLSRLLLYFGAMPLEGFVISKLWAWFVAAQFALPLINVGEGIGLAILVSLFTYQFDPKFLEEDEGEQWIRAFASYWIPLVAFGLGFVVHWLMT